MERLKNHQTLVCLLQSLVGRCTTIELRNENCIWGCIQFVDANMNIFLNKGVIKSINGQLSACDHIYIQGKNIRFVQIPDDIDMFCVIEKQVNQLNYTKREGAKQMKKEYNKLEVKLKRQKKINEKVKALQNFVGKS